MRAAVALRNVVGEAQYRFMIGVVPPQGALNRDAVALRLDHQRLGDQRRLVAVEIFDEGLNTAVINHLLALLDRVPHIGQNDQHAGIEEGQFAQAMLERGEIELDHGESFGRRQERHFGAALAVRLADNLQRRHRDAVAEFDEVFMTIAPDGQLEPGR